MKNNLSKKLAGYSALTTYMLLSNQQTRAQIIYTDIPDVKITHNNSDYGLDLNNDGITDFGFFYTDNEGVNILAGTNYFTGENYFFNGSIQLSSNGYLIEKLNFLDPISPLNPWASLDYENVFIGYSSVSSQVGLWQGGVLNGYAGLKMNLGGNSYYGWMRCYVKKDGSLMIIKDYAYNSVPNMPIHAGDEGCSDNFEPNNSKPQATAVQPNTLIRAQIANTNDVDWYSFSIPGNQNNASIVLSSMLKNYDIKLVDHNGLQIAKSVNIGGNNDTIIYNGLAAANYFVKVYGKNGNSSSVDCYSLFVETSATPFRASDSQIFDNNSNELTVFPNPVSESATIQFSIENASSVTINLFDLQGGKIKTITEGNYNAGDHQLLLEKEKLTPGIYFIQLNSNSAIATHKLIIE